MTDKGKKDIYSLTPSAAVQLLLNNGFKASQADNIFRDIYAGGADCFDKMALTSKKVTALLQSEFYFGKITAVKRYDSSDTVKYLFSLSDGCSVETVLMRQRYANSVCVSTQSGCNMGCKFCCSGRLKKQRDLTIGEMVQQLLYIEKEQGIHIGNVTVMGIGEPLDNYDNLCGFLNIIASPFGFAIGTKHITVSTCGIVPKIDELSRRDNPCNLALSLHAPNDVIRNALMPINKRYPIDEVIAAAVRYSKACNRKILLEYVMIDGVNDSEDCAAELARLIGKERLFVNLIPYNESPDGGFKRSGRERIMRFYDILKKHGIGVTMRREFGGGLDAACGQLRSDRLKITLARYKSSDLSELVTLFCDTVKNVCKNDYTPAQLDAWAGAPDFSAWEREFSEKYTIVACCDGKIAGFGNIDKHGLLDMLYVHKDFQRRGIASEIATVLEDYPDTDEITVHASITARGFFEKRGYIAVKENKVRRENEILINYTMIKRTDK